MAKRSVCRIEKTAKAGVAAFSFLLASLAAHPSPALAQEESQQFAAVTPEAAAIPSRGMEEPVSLDFKSTDVVDALKYLALKGGFNLATTKTVTGRVTLSLTDVPIRDVFELILRSNGLAYMRQGNIYHVMSEEEYKVLNGKKYSDLRQVQTFRLKYAAPEAAFNMLDALKSEIGRLLVDEDSATVVIMDTPAALQRIESALETLEKQATIRVFDLRYANAKQIEERLKDHLELRKLGFVKADERSNQLIVKTLPDRMKDVERMIALLDRKTREVLIDAKIIQVNLTDNLDSGIDWDAVFRNIKFHGVDKVADFRQTSTTTAASVAQVPLGNKWGKLALGLLNNDGYELLRYLETLGQTKLVATPRVLVVHNQEAKILVGTREAYVTTTTTTGQSTSTTAEQVQFIDVGTQLSVTPSINSDGYITMKIKPEVSSVVRTLTTPIGNQIPIVSTSTAETLVMVKDGTTVVLGGLAQDTKKYENDQVPLFGRIPLFGEFFRQRDRDNSRQELVVFITPHIVSGDEFVSGDEKTGAFKSFRDYNPIREDDPRLEELEEKPREEEPSPPRFRLRKSMRERS
ncbi:MAG: hypothetical protein NC910_04470 [Candidatus Omnitrophica bacterium]|nr:hypothetical protein [Candidatus Omnitrophota bacterium]